MNFKVNFVYDGKEFLLLEESELNLQAIKILELLIKENSEQCKLFIIFLT